MNGARGSDVDHDTAGLRAWLEYVAQTAIDWLDALDAPADEREPEEDVAP